MIDLSPFFIKLIIVRCSNILLSDGRESQPMVGKLASMSMVRSWRVDASYLGCDSSFATYSGTGSSDLAFVARIVYVHDFFFGLT